MYYEATYRVGARDTDPFRQCRPSSILNFLQEAATDAAGALHVSQDEIAERYHCFWMLARMWYRLDEPLFWQDELTVHTWHRGGKGVSMYRDFDLYRGGKPIGEAVSVWVLADLDTHKLKKLAEVEEFRLTTGGELCKSIKLHRSHMPEKMTLAERRLLHYSDCDVNGHVNNVRYADFTADAVGLDKLGFGRFVSSLHISYLKECRPGETVSLYAGERDGVFCVRGADSTEVDRFEAEISLKNCP